MPPSPTHLRKEVLGYEIHTNRELGMMLRGIKPLAVFSDARGHFSPVLLRYLRLFDRHVASGAFIKRVHSEAAGRIDTSVELEVVLYALPKEAWRIDAMIALRDDANWSVEHERREGALLGYTHEQNEIWIEKRFGR